MPRPFFCIAVAGAVPRVLVPAFSLSLTPIYSIAAVAACSSNKAIQFGLTGTWQTGGFTHSVCTVRIGAPSGARAPSIPFSFSSFPFSFPLFTHTRFTPGLLMHLHHPCTRQQPKNVFRLLNSCVFSFLFPFPFFLLPFISMHSRNPSAIPFVFNLNPPLCVMLSTLIESSSSPVAYIKHINIESAKESREPYNICRRRAFASLPPGGKTLLIRL